MKKTFSWFRKVAFAEGVSFLVLLGIAMPLKYFANMPFILAREVKVDYKKDFKWFAKAGLASVLPFGTIVMDREWKKEEAAAKTI